MSKTTETVETLTAKIEAMKANPSPRKFWARDLNRLVAERAALAGDPFATAERLKAEGWTSDRAIDRLAAVFTGQEMEDAAISYRSKALESPESASRSFFRPYTSQNLARYIVEQIFAAVRG